MTGYLGNAGVYFTQRLLDKGYHVVGVDNNSRGQLLGADGDVRDNSRMLVGYPHLDQRFQDIVDMNWSGSFPFGFDVIIHAASQVSHPRSIEIPMEDFEINAVGALNLLEYVRNVSPHSQFIYIGSAKVYGENVDKFSSWQYPTRFDYFKEILPSNFRGISEKNTSLDQTMRTPFGVSKLYADLITQEYGRLYGLNTVVLRPSCFAGKFTRPTIWQRWEAYIMQKILRGETVEVFGYGGRQVRDILHCDDLTDAIMMMIDRPPKQKGDVFNIGGGRDNSISVNELIARVEKDKGIKAKVEYKEKRQGDWKIFVTDNRKLMAEYPEWKVRRSLDYVINELYEALPLLS